MKTYTDDLRYVWNKPNSTVARIIIINVVVFVLVNLVKLFSPQTGALVVEYLGVPSEALTFITRPWTLITYFFTHEGFFHILMNMLMLYWFGAVVQEFLNSRKVTALYVLGGLAGGLGYLLTSNLIPFFAANNGNLMIGASAGVFAVVAGAATIAPDYRFNLLFLGPVKIKWVALALIVLALFGLRGANTGGEVAHLSGAAIGFLFITQLRKGVDISSPFMRAMDWVQGVFRSGSKMKVSYKRQSSAARSKVKRATTADYAGKPNQQVIDTILDKISQSGYDKLTTEEKQILFHASQQTQRSS
jgi:membrane associated rhomboid family serine protease